MKYVTLDKFKLLLFVLSFWALHATGNDTLTFHHVTGNISQSTISKIFQDNDGFLWFGTRYGLNKYDGQYFYHYLHDPTDSSSLSNSRINDVVVDKKGNFWIATDLGLNYFDRELGVFQRILQNPSSSHALGNNFIVSLYLDGVDKLWIGTEGQGMAMYDIESKSLARFRHNKDDPFSISSNHVTAINEDSDGNLWVGTRGGGLNLFDRNFGRFIRYDLNQKGSNSPRVLLNTENGMWIGSNDGLFLMKYREAKYEINPFVIPSQPEMTQKLSDATILSLMEDAQNNLWVGTENRGLLVLNTTTFQSSHYSHSATRPNSLSSNSIWSLFKDKTGIIWIGTYAHGLDKIDPLHREITRHSDESLSGNAISYKIVSSFLQDGKKGLWIGTDGGGLNYFDYETGDISVYEQGDGTQNLISNAVLSLVKDDQENLWIAQWEGGVSVRLKETGTFTKITTNTNDPNALLGMDAHSLYKDTKGNIWVSLFRDGLSIYNSDRQLLRTLIADESKPLSISNPKVRCILESEPGVFWLGTDGNGLDRIEVDEDYRIVAKQNYNVHRGDTASLGHDVVTHLHMSGDGLLWLTTFGSGVSVFDPGTKEFKSLRKRDGLSSDVVLSIEEDLDGNMWVGTSNGLSRITPDFRIKNFGNEDGLYTDEFTKSASFLNDRGELFFGSNNGYYRFNPRDIKENELIPPVILTGFEVRGSTRFDFANGRSLKEVFPAKRITLKHNENDFSFQFAVLNYTQPNKNQYAYMLEGYDESWRYSTDGYNIDYSNVLPGTYTFRAKGANNDGVWNEEGAEILLIIERPWYFSNLAFFIYLILFSLLLFLFRGTIINRERLKNELKVEHLQLTKMQEVSKLKSRFFANISHEFRTPLTLIIGPLKSLINGTFKGDSRSQYRIMARNAERLLRLINQILDLSKLESGTVQLQASNGDIVKFLKPIAHAFSSYAERQFIDYKCKFPDHPIEIYFEPDRIEKIVINLLSNAFKYTQEFKKIIFEVVDGADQIKLMVRDEGMGIESSQLPYVFDRFYQTDNGQRTGTGIGLALTKELVDLHKGEIEVKSKVGLGTTFIVSLKKGRSHLTEEDIISLTEPTHQFEEDFKELELVKDMAATSIDDSSQSSVSDLPLILVAEDNADMRLFISEYLVTNYRILEAINGEDALNLAHEHIPDVIISDIIMPKMNGYELCEKIKSDERTSHIPVILLTAKASGESTERGFELGADYYVTKPFNPKLLELRIKNILKTREQLSHQLLNIQEHSLEPKDLKIASKDREFLKKAIECVQNNLSNSNFGVDDLHKELGLSRTQLYRKLKGLVGQSANEFIRSFRLKRAAQLLRQQELTISEITYQVGFNDLQYFRYCFKKQFGSTPSEYLQNLQQNA